MDLTVHQLRIVLAVARTGSFTAAGDSLTLAQSSLSRAVADVERRLGVRLFERTTRRVVLTPEGEAFAKVAEEVVASFDRGMNHFRGFLDGSSGTVRIATLPSLAATLLPPLVTRFREAHPGVTVQIEDGLLAQGLEQVRTGEVDFAVTRCAAQTDSGWVRPIAADEFVCVLPPGHPLATQDQVAWSDLRDVDFVGFHPTSSVRTHVDDAFARAGVTPRSMTEARNIASVGGLVAAGQGVSAVPSLVLPLLSFAGLEHRPLVEPVVTRTVGVVLDPDRPLAKASQAFLELIATAKRSGLRLPPGATWLGRVNRP